MQCKQVGEVLPWLLNRTLGDDERRQIEKHLEDCPACRHELAETSFAGEVFQQHLSTEQLVAYGFGETLAGDDQSLVLKHLASCTECADELELVRASHHAAEGAITEEARVLPWPGHRPSVVPTWHWGVLAASLLFGTVGIFGWLQSEQKLSRVAKLEARISELESPHLNIWVTDVLPSDVALRDATAEAMNTLKVPAGASSLTAILAYDGDANYPSYDVDLVGEDGRLQWTGQGLRREETGDFTLSFGINSLPQGPFTLQIHGVNAEGRQRVASYPIVLIMPE